VVVGAEFEFFKIQWNVLWVYSMVFHQSFLGKNPEAIDTVDVDFSIRELFNVIDSPLTKTIGDLHYIVGS